jgi:hypothetical protein
MVSVVSSIGVACPIGGSEVSQLATAHGLPFLKSTKVLDRRTTHLVAGHRFGNPGASVKDCLIPIKRRADTASSMGRIDIPAA